MTATKAREWLPLILGTVGIIFVSVVWLVTDRIEPSLIALFGSLVGVSEGANALKDLRSDGRRRS